MSAYARVLVDLSSADVDRPFTYAIPEGMSLCAGQRVLAPFGGRSIEGVALEITDDSDVAADKIRPLIRTLEDYPVLLPEMIDLAYWMRDTYHCTLALAIRQMIPAQLRGERVREKRENVARLLLRADEAAQAIEKRSRAPKQAQIIRLLLSGDRTTSALNAAVPGASSALSALKKQGVIQVDSRRVERRPFMGEETRGHDDPEPTGAQREAEQSIARAMDNGGGRFLLVGVTGSGKTEVYIRAIRRALSQGRGAIVLVPEIALTPQMTDWFCSRFGDTAAVLHSRLSPGERYDEWRRIRSGEARVVVGARSAVFAPIENPALIVVDEEHDSAYQSDKRPRYDAREVAKARCARSGGCLVLGSATPSIASYMKVMPGVRPENRLTLLELNERVFNRPMPDVQLVDMCEELSRGNRSIFSAALWQALQECLNAGEQAMLLMNRRGYSTFVSCRACGHVEKCEQCDVSMTYHQTDGLMHCHYCGDTRKPPVSCPVCASPFIKFFGTGTQKVEEEVKKLFPGARVARMDMDTTRGKDGHEKILSAFRRGETNVLVGTQMIAKGLDFPKVTLVGVIAADMTLNLPDYRSAERTFQLITQVAGRAGRAQYAGRVIVQSYQVDSYAIKLAAKQDYRAFYQLESKYRRRALYPPFTVMARILYTGLDANAVVAAAQQAETAFNAWLDEGERRKNVIQMRALEAPIGKLRGETRHQVFIKLYARPAADEILLKMDDLTAEAPKGVTAELEINPANMF